MKTKIIIIFFITLCAVASYVFANFSDSSKKMFISNKDLQCPGGQTVKGIHEQCISTGCVVDFLHCS